MRIISSSITVQFPIIHKIREHLFEFEKVFDTFQKPFTLITLPDDAPPEFPRIQAISDHGYSNLMVTLNNAQITTNYDANFNTDFKKCFSYISQMKEQLVNSIKKILSGEFSFCGISITAGIDNDNPIELLADKFLKVESARPLQDTAIRMTYQLNSKYYFNIEIQNLKSYSGIPQGDPYSLYGLTEQESFIQIVVDLNDRRAFNNTPNYVSEANTLDYLISVSEDFIISKVDGLLEKGVIDFDDNRNS